MCHRIVIIIIFFYYPLLLLVVIESMVFHAKSNSNESENRSSIYDLSLDAEEDISCAASSIDDLDITCATEGEILDATEDDDY